MIKKAEKMRFLLTPMAVVVAFALSVIIGWIIAQVLGIWWEPVVGFVAALGVVVAGYAIAPCAKMTVGIVVFIVGVFTAWKLVGMSCYPEGYPQAYEETYSPLFSTYVGGIVGLIICFAFNYLQKNNKATPRGPQKGPLRSAQHRR